jgi:hypothetical protein
MTTQAEERAEDQRIGRVLLSQYRIDALLGEGGMGAVYKGEQLSVSRPVAIKLISGKIAENPECVRRFRREAEAMAKLRHPNTVRLFEFGVADQELFMVMELLEGRDLSEELTRRQRLPPVEALAITRQVLEALAEAHTLGIVHRDLKPANVFLSQVHGGRVMAKVMDFGIAGIESTANTKLTMQGAVMGTPAYMSPEQAQGKAVDPRSDLYSLGVVLYEMLVGKPPFEADSAVSLLVAHVSTAPPRLLDTTPALAQTRGLQDLLDALLHKNPDKRPGSAQATLDMVDGLLRQLGDTSGSSRHIALAANSAAPMRADGATSGVTVAGLKRSSGLWWVATALLAALGVFLLWPHNREAPAEARVPDLPKVEKATAAPATPAPGALVIYKVQVLSKPAGASLEIAGVEIGKTPFDLQFRQPTLLQVKLAGYAHKAIRIDADTEPLFVVELDPLPITRTKSSRRDKGAPDEAEPLLAAPAPVQAPAPEPTPPTAAPAPPPPAAPAPLPVIVQPAAQPLAVTQSASGVRGQPSVVLPPPSWIKQPAPGTQLSPRDRRTAMLQTGPLAPNVAAAKRARQSGKLSADAYDDTIWVLKTRRNDRIQFEKQSYKAGVITRDEYERRVARIDAEYEGR